MYELQCIQARHAGCSYVIVKLSIWTRLDCRSGAKETVLALKKSRDRVSAAIKVGFALRFGAPAAFKHAPIHHELFERRVNPVSALCEW